MAPLLFSTSAPLTCQLSPLVSIYCTCQRPSSHPCWWRLTNSGRCSKQRHGNCRWIPSQLEVTAQYYKSNVEAKRDEAVLKLLKKLNVSWKLTTTTKHCPFSLSPHTLLWSNVGQNITYRWHLKSLHKKLSSRVALLRRLAGSDWDAEATTLRTATWALVHSTTGYWGPVWCRDAYTHLIDTATNNALRFVTGCLRPTPADNLPILAGIQPAELRDKGATLSIARHPMGAGHFHYSALICPSSGNVRHLNSSHSFVPNAQQLIS